MGGQMLLPIVICLAFSSFILRVSRFQKNLQPADIALKRFVREAWRPTKAITQGD